MFIERINLWKLVLGVGHFRKPENHMVQSVMKNVWLANSNSDDKLSEPNKMTIESLPVRSSQSGDTDSTSVQQKAARRSRKKCDSYK